MGETSIVVNDFVRNKRRFADVFNGFCFGGEVVIRPEDLEDGSEQYVLEQESDVKLKVTERSRDVKMRLKNGGVLRVLAIENQDYVDYTMPFRCMEYDCLEYGRQLQELKDENKQQKSLTGSNEWLSGVQKTDRLKPMYTVCIYHGEDAWDGPRTLREMMDFGEDTDVMSELFSDYSMKLFCINECDDFDMFHTEVREVFTALNYRKNKAAMQNLMEENEAYRHLDGDSLRVLSVLLKKPKIWEERAKYMSKKDEQEEYDMCLALREWEAEARAEGRSQGLMDGFFVASRIVKALQADSTLTNETVAEMCACSVIEVEAVRNAFEI